jgi:hypothetical protein
MMIFAAAAAAVALNVTIDLGPKKNSASGRAPVVTCHKGAVSYNFVGTPGTKFSYGGDEYVLPIEGSIELLADRKSSEYILAGSRLPVDVGPLDAFGTRTVEIPMPEPQLQAQSQTQSQATQSQATQSQATPSSKEPAQ